RPLTWLIHIDVAGIGDVQAGGVHLHHYVWGILLLAVVGAASLAERSARARAWLGLAYGVGLALVVDEAALLISLEDVYWDTEGGISIALAIALIAIVGSVLASTRGSAPPEMIRTMTADTREQGTGQPHRTGAPTPTPTVLRMSPAVGQLGVDSFPSECGFTDVLCRCVRA
ncbi:hypothetical protein ACH4FX_43170, partial [Streptomyces sp. NPDC018019]